MLNYFYAKAISFYCGNRLDLNLISIVAFIRKLFAYYNDAINKPYQRREIDFDIRKRNLLLGWVKKDLKL